MQKVILEKHGLACFIHKTGEPVFLVQGQDDLAASTACYWAALAESRGVDPELLQVVRNHARQMATWSPKTRLEDRGLPSAGQRLKLVTYSIDLQKVEYAGLVWSVNHQDKIIEVELTTANQVAVRSKMTHAAFRYLLEQGTLELA